MRNYTESLATRSNMARYRIAESAVGHFPVADPQGGWWRCHEVARAIALLLEEEGLPVTVVDGKFCSIDHTWLAWRDEGSPYLRILDPYCVGSLPQVRLMVGDGSLGDSIRCYRPDHGLVRGDIDQSLVALLVESVLRSRG